MNQTALNMLDSFIKMTVDEAKSSDDLEQMGKIMVKLRTWTNTVEHEVLNWRQTTYK